MRVYFVCVAILSLLVLVLMELETVKEFLMETLKPTISKVQG